MQESWPLPCDGVDEGEILSVPPSPNFSFCYLWQEGDLVLGVMTAGEPALSLTATGLGRLGPKSHLGSTVELVPGVGKLILRA